MSMMNYITIILFQKYIYQRTRLCFNILYCATIALGGYSSHFGKIHYIQDGNLSLYMQHHLQQTPAINPPHSFHLLYFQPILLASKLSHLQVTSSAHPQQPSSITPVHQRGGPTLQFLSFLKEAMECDGK